MKAQEFNKKADEDDFYRWSSLRSSYQAEANADVAWRYAETYSPGFWYGAGWYWDPWFDAYTFLPANGLFYSPFGWGFYSPFYVYGVPYFRYGHYYRHFTPLYRPPAGVVPRAGGFPGPARGFNGGAAGGFRAPAGGGFHSSGGGFRGGRGR